MTTPQPPSQTLRERMTQALVLAWVRHPTTPPGVSGTPENVYFSVVKAVDALLPFVEAALAAQEASPQPDLAREWFEKGFQAGLSAIDKFGEQHDTAEEAYLACRQEQP